MVQRFHSAEKMWIRRCGSFSPDEFAGVDVQEENQVQPNLRPIDIHGWCSSTNGSAPSTVMQPVSTRLWVTNALKIWDQIQRLMGCTKSGPVRELQDLVHQLRKNGPSRDGTSMHQCISMPSSYQILSLFESSACFGGIGFVARLGAASSIEVAAS